MTHFKKYWDENMHTDVLDTVQKKVCHLSIYLMSDAYD